MNKEFTLIGTKRFSIEDQLYFADFSGDRNPIHLDKLTARKSLVGDCVVHGVNGLLWALNCLCRKTKTKFRTISARFLRPIYLDQQVTCVWNPISRRIKLFSNDGVSYLVAYEVSEHTISKTQNFPLPVPLNNLSTPWVLEFEKIELGREHRFEGGGKIDALGVMYSDLVGSIGLNTVYEVATLSNIIGMQVPGLNSLFLECKINFLTTNSNTYPQYMVESKDDRFKLINLKYSGRNFVATLLARELPFYKPKSCSQIKRIVPSTKNLNGEKILIVGGSRGLGAAVARVASMLGADVTITYHRCESDAACVAEDIRKHCNLDTKILKLDVTNTREVESIRLNYVSLYYFASPKITPTKNGFNIESYQEYFDVYCKYFEVLAEKFLKNGGLKIFWPSTVFLEDPKNKFSEYVAAKYAGEQICKKLSERKSARVVYPRLGQILTDQTIGVYRDSFSDAVEVAIEIATLMGNSRTN